ncbi:MAG: hypothetical protein JWM27_3514 [Gemmatimonadetes bacterium]|nr:hypothetical protein [Gemmatimonadota bacterium]
MRKLRLDLDALSVDSFETAAAEPERGTVHAHLSRDGVCSTYFCTDEESCAYTGCGDCTLVDTCQANESCGISCRPTCFTCAQTCEC